MNAYKGGKLESLSMKYIIGNVNLNNFFKSFQISDQDHEFWYGEEKEANKMEKGQLERKTYCKLKDLDIGYGKH